MFYLQNFLGSDQIVIHFSNKHMLIFLLFLAAPRACKSSEPGVELEPQERNGKSLTTRPPWNSTNWLFLNIKLIRKKSKTDANKNCNPQRWQPLERGLFPELSLVQPSERIKHLEDWVTDLPAYSTYRSLPFG